MRTIVIIFWQILISKSINNGYIYIEILYLKKITGRSMMNKRELELLECLPQSTFIAGSELAAKLKISEKTCRGLMGSLMQDIREASADIIVKKGKGYQLTVHDPDRFEQWLTLNKRELTETIPQFWDERISLVLSYLLNQRGFVKRRDLGELLYVSEKTISAVLKRRNRIFSFHSMDHAGKYTFFW